MNVWLKKVFTKNKKMKIQFCQNNLDRFFDNESLRLFEGYVKEHNVSTKEYECLSECELCKKKPYVKVNGEIISAENTKELLRRLL